MIRIIIGDVESEISNISDSWIQQHINRRIADGQNVCVKVIIQKNNLNIVLSTPACPSGQASRRPNEDEAAIFKLWEQSGLNSTHFVGDNLIAFLKKIKNI